MLAYHQAYSHYPYGQQEWVNMLPLPLILITSTTLEWVVQEKMENTLFHLPQLLLRCSPHPSLYLHTKRDRVSILAIWVQAEEEGFIISLAPRTLGLVILLLSRLCE
jgi:hypothetical protein